MADYWDAIVDDVHQVLRISEDVWLAATATSTTTSRSSASATPSAWVNDETVGELPDDVSRIAAVFVVPLPHV